MWKHDHRPSMFLKDKSMKIAAQSSASQTAVIERERMKGNTIGLVTENTKQIKLLTTRQLLVFSRAAKYS
jgi:hypothetical protein